MLEYVILIAVPFLFYGINTIVKTDMKIRNRQTLILFFTMFTFLLCCRDFKVGGDVRVYLDEFSKYKTTPWSDITKLQEEWGWFIFNKLLSYVTTDGRVLIVLCALLAVLPVAIFYVIEGKNALVVISLFLVAAPFTMFFSGLRQSITMGWGLIAFLLLTKKRWLWFLIIVAIAFTLHQSAFMLLFLLPIYFIKVKTRWAWIAVLVGIILFIFKTPLFNVVNSILPIKYKENEAVATNAYNLLLFIIGLAIYAFLVGDEKKMRKIDYTYRLILIFSVFIQIFASVSGYSTRMNYYFMMFIPVAVSNCVHTCKDTHKNFVFIVNFVLCIFCIAYYFYLAIYGGDILQVYPYVWGFSL